MPPFRVGKPWRIFGLATDKQHPPGHNLIPWDTVVGDPDPVGEAPATTWTVTKAGLYLLTYNVARPITGTAGALFTTLRVNNVQMAGNGVPSTTGSIQVSASAILPLVVGDLVTVFASLHGTAATPFNRQLTWLRLARIGPVRWT